ncbi:MAG: dihydroorotase [Pseudomonadota bacterium]
MTKRITITKPDDWHLHLRDGDMLKAVAGHTAAHFSRAIIMPNLVPPVVTGADASAYRDRIMAALPPDTGFQPQMTLYLTEDSEPQAVTGAYRDGIVKAVKLYPAGATTNSHNGVRDISRVMPVLEAMAEVGMPLCVHGEVTDADVDIFDREKAFIDTVLDPLRAELPELKIVMEHVTTSDGIDYVKSSKQNLAATLTVHHLIINRNAILAGGIKPHYYCLPVAKRESHRLALRAAAVSGDKRIFLGTDSAPHTDANKEMACGCAGCFTALNAMACLAHVFEEENRLEALEGFTSQFGADWYNLPRNEGRITLVRREQPVEYPSRIATDEGPVTVFDPMFDIYWEVETQ